MNKGRVRVSRQKCDGKGMKLNTKAILGALQQVDADGQDMKGPRAKKYGLVKCVNLMVRLLAHQERKDTILLGSHWRDPFDKKMPLGSTDAIKQTYQSLVSTRLSRGASERALRKDANPPLHTNI
jgi:hypothetical protein